MDNSLQCRWTTSWRTHRKKNFHTKERRGKRKDTPRTQVWNRREQSGKPLGPFSGFLFCFVIIGKMIQLQVHLQLPCSFVFLFPIFSLEERCIEGELKDLSNDKTHCFVAPPDSGSLQERALSCGNALTAGLRQDAASRWPDCTLGRPCLAKRGLGRPRGIQSIAVPQVADCFQ